MQAIIPEDSVQEFLERVIRPTYKYRIGEDTHFLSHLSFIELFLYLDDESLQYGQFKTAEQVKDIARGMIRDKDPETGVNVEIGRMVVYQGANTIVLMDLKLYKEN